MVDQNMYSPLAKHFFQATGLQLAQQLLGKFIIHELPSETLIGRIVETEAYQGPNDKAAHSYGNRKTKRTEVMYKEAGLVYTYQMHTHTLTNVIANSPGIPHAVLIRAIEPVQGIKKMQANRGFPIKDANITNGPGKLTQAMEITMKYYGHHWSKNPLYIADGPNIKEIIAGPRVGVGNSREAAQYPWRFFEKNNPFVSKYRK